MPNKRAGFGKARLSWAVVVGFVTDDNEDGIFGQPGTENTSTWRILLLGVCQTGPRKRGNRAPVCYFNAHLCGTIASQSDLWLMSAGTQSLTSRRSCFCFGPRDSGARGCRNLRAACVFFDHHTVTAGVRLVVVVTSTSRVAGTPGDVSVVDVDEDDDCAKPTPDISVRVIVRRAEFLTLCILHITSQIGRHDDGHDSAAMYGKVASVLKQCF